MKITIDELLKGCEHDGSFIPVSEVKRLMEEYYYKRLSEVFPSADEINKVAYNSYRGMENELEYRRAFKEGIEFIKFKLLV